MKISKKSSLICGKQRKCRIFKICFVKMPFSLPKYMGDFSAHALNHHLVPSFGGRHVALEPQMPSNVEIFLSILTNYTRNLLEKSLKT